MSRLKTSEQRWCVRSRTTKKTEYPDTRLI